MLKKFSSPRYVKKQRILVRDFGQANDLKCWYSSTSLGTLAASYPLTVPNPDWCRAMYYLGEASRGGADVPGIDWAGNEVLTTSVGNRSGFNNCSHVKTQAKCLPYFIGYEQYNNSTTINVSYYARSSVPSLVRKDVGSIAIYRGAGQVGMDQQFSARAYWSMRPKFEGDVSIVNSLFELKDFKDVLNLSKQLKQFGRASKVIRDFSDYRRIAKTSAKESTSFLQGLARDTTGTAANAWLTYMLAVMPTIKDVLAIQAQLLQDVSEQQQIFADYGAIGTTSHFSERAMFGSLETAIPVYNRYPFPYGLNILETKTATMRMKYSYIMRNRNEALRKFWGLTGTAEQLWNMLPLSFVLDYFLGLGKALSYMDWDERVTDLKTEYCESVKILVTSGAHIIQSPRTPALIIDGKILKPITGERRHLVTGYEGTFYERQVMEPYKGPAFPKFKKPSSTQAGTMLALARCFIS